MQVPARNIIVIAHDMRSTHNVGSLLRTAECLGVDKVYLTGYSPYPSVAHDTRLPHIGEKLTKQIVKTSLGAEHSVNWEHHEDFMTVYENLSQQGYRIIGLEQAPTSTPLPQWKPSNKLALLLGREVEGIDPALLRICDEVVEIPQYGIKESLNVVQAAAIGLYHARFAPFA